MKRIQIYITYFLLLIIGACSPSQNQDSSPIFELLTSHSAKNGPQVQFHAFSTDPSIIHSLDYANSDLERKIFTGDKNYNGTVDKVFLDGLGREIGFRGFNISGNAKLAQHGFKPFANDTDADIGFSRLAKTNGSNLIRFTIAWEGVHTAVDTINYAYLDAIIAQMRKAISKRMYVLIDYHQDLFSRNLFNKSSWYTGNGAPSWIISGGSYPSEYCGIVCANWSQNNLTNEAIRRAFRNFWNNASLSTSAGTRYMQTEYLWQVGKAAAYIKSSLSDQEFDYIVGLDPFNEPVDGGMEGLTPAQWDNQKLWPFHYKIRDILNQNGWENKWVFAEPLVFWNTNVGAAIAPATGGGHLLSQPGPGFVFNSHFYDAGRMGTDLTGIDNATYFKYLDDIRTEARFLNIPVFLSEFGMWLKGTGAKDTPRMINAVYQAMEISDKAQSTKTRFADLYNPVVSGTQWHWDYYYNNHKEYMNGNTSKLLTTKDAWNDEDFSVVGNYGANFNVDYHVIQRAYFRRSQGRVMSSHYNAIGYDTWNNVFKWAAIRTTDTGTKYFGDQRFLFLVWKGRNSEAPTEIYLPPHFSKTDTILITEKKIYNKLIPSSLNQDTNEAIVIDDRSRDTGSGMIALVWDDLDQDEDTNDSIHYALLVDGQGISFDNQILQTLQAGLNQRLNTDKKSPIYFTGKMTYSGYPTEQ
ncbi:glycosyl hydrolase family 5 [Leptospira langatensis]|uniref:Glycosyl hydrolase family 5 n=1 Tax=Leptospira langatensis TaxID=2484983 RepID=A0A5F1ZUP8_9LEPT|nr:glycosyl hydrolase family 5 [Leptospira langatensis]TGJ98780.1 glycosyl hydrolase family 5 [Leptospira langatensis]TGL40653.1 glycosyl hydrolase family 5 [Leptospira langatensis]